MTCITKIVVGEPLQFDHEFRPGSAEHGQENQRSEPTPDGMRHCGYPPEAHIEPPHVCPGCYAVGDEPHLSWCIDDEIDRERRFAIENGDYDRSEEDDDQ